MTAQHRSNYEIRQPFHEAAAQASPRNVYTKQTDESLAHRRVG